MHLSGTHNFTAPAKLIFSMLMDAEVLARITPGISRLEKTGEDQYKAIAQVKMGPVSGSFTGDLEIRDKNEPHSFALSVRQKSRIGDVTAEVRIQLRKISQSETELQFDGKAKLTGLIARTGQRVLSGVSNTLSRQFFLALEKELQNNESA